jgi:hypothetical protein
MIEVQQISTSDPFGFDVTVKEGGGQTRHRVTMKKATYDKLTGGRVPPDRCIEAAFEFLLERESKESILSTFDVTVISRYFPSFERDIARYLSKTDQT